MKTAAIFALLLAALSARAEQRPDEFYDPDVQRLIKVEQFSFGVGMGGGQSDGELAFAAVIKKKEAIRYFLAVVDFGRPEAQCYALIALRESSPKLYAESVMAFRRHMPKTITVVRGCIVTETEPTKVLEAIDAGKYSAYFEQYEEEANQSLEPTSMLGTSAAEPPRVPSTLVAHL